MKWLPLAVLLFPAVLVAGAEASPASRAGLAENWVKESLDLARNKGVEAMLAGIQDPKGKFASGQPEADPELTVYSRDLTVLAVNRASRHINMNHAKAPDAGGSPILKRMYSTAQASGPGWLEYLGTDPSGRPKAFKAYVALQGTNLIAAVIPRQ